MNKMNKSKQTKKSKVNKVNETEEKKKSVNNVMLNDPAQVQLNEEKGKRDASKVSIKPIQLIQKRKTGSQLLKKKTGSQLLNSIKEANKSKQKDQERQSEINRKQEKKTLKAQKSEELKIQEHQLREERLKPTCAMLLTLSHKKYEHDQMCRDELNWKHTIECNGTPNPRVLQELNTYIYFKKQLNHANENWNFYEDNCLDIFNIINAVDDIVDLPLNFNQFKLQCFRESKDNLGRLLIEIVYEVCYYLLSDYDRRMDPIDLETVAYQKSCEAFSVGLHVVCHRPRLRTDNRSPPKCNFPECLVMVDVPPQLSQQYMAIMVLWLRWDPFRDRIVKFDVSNSLESDIRDLWQYSEDMWEERNQILKTLNEKKEQMKKKSWNINMEEKLKLFTAVDPSNYPDDLKAYIDELRENETEIIIENILEYEAVQEMDERQDEVEIKDEPQIPEEVKATKSTTHIDFEKSPSQEMEKNPILLKYPEKPNELNPRRYWIIGGVFNVEMWKLPMQPVKLKDGSVCVLIQGPAALQPIDYYEKYEPLHFPSTSLVDQKTDVKEQNQEALERLTMVHIKLSENVLWFENPKPAMWNEEKKVWTTDYIYDVRFNEEKQMVSFRTGRMGFFGLAVNRYSNFPFQTWEIRPEDSSSPYSGVILSVTSATVLIEFAVRGDHVAMVQLQNATTAVVQELIGVYHRPDKLVRLLRRSGINLFPEPDALHYVDGRRPPKHAVAERHTYRCMAALSGTHQFTASQKNVHVATDRIVMQMKEIPVDAAGFAATADDGGVRVPFQMIMVTPERAVLLKCNEVDQTFSEEPLNTDDDTPFAPDLFTLAADTASTDHVRAALADVRDFKTVQTLYYLLDKIKPLSYT